MAFVLACPSHNAMVEVATPADSSSMAAVCGRVCGVACLVVKGGALRGSSRKVRGHQIGDRVAAEVPTSARGEQRVARLGRRIEARLCNGSEFATLAVPGRQTQLRCRCRGQ